MFTVARLGVTGRLRRSLTNTNCIESMFSITRTTTGRVKHWRDGTMKKRWIAAGMLEAERSFRRIKGYGEMPALVAAIARATTPGRCHTHQLRSGRLSKFGITTELQHERDILPAGANRDYRLSRERHRAGGPGYLGRGRGRIVGRVTRTPVDDCATWPQ